MNQIELYECLKQRMEKQKRLVQQAMKVQIMQTFNGLASKRSIFATSMVIIA